MVDLLLHAQVHELAELTKEFFKSFRGVAVDKTAHVLYDDGLRLGVYRNASIFAFVLVMKQLAIFIPFVDLHFRNFFAADEVLFFRISRLS